MNRSYGRFSIDFNRLGVEDGHSVSCNVDLKLFAETNFKMCCSIDKGKVRGGKITLKSVPWVFDF